MIFLCLRFALVVTCWSRVNAGIGADLPWTTYEAEAMNHTGIVLGPRYDPHLVETEASGQQCVKLTASGAFVEFSSESDANALVVRYSLPDAESGGRRNTTLSLFVNGRQVSTLALTSRYSWLYGDYPFSNQPEDLKPRNCYDELRVKDLKIAKGDVVRLQKTVAEDSACIVDFVDLETVGPALTAPANALSVLEFGAAGNGENDDTAALSACVAAAQQQGKIVWVPAGDYKLTGDIIVPSLVRIQGAGMWHTTFVGDEKLYLQPDRRVRIKLIGEQIHLADFAITGKLNYRDDREANDGIVGAGCAASSVSRVWVEHTKRVFGFITVTMC